MLLVLCWLLLRDYVKKIAVYKDRLAVQLPNKVVLYELAGAQGRDQENGAPVPADEYDMQVGRHSRAGSRFVF